MVISKVCTLCDTEKPLDEFGCDRGARDGRNCWCKACSAAKSREWRAANPEKVRASREAYRKRNPRYHRRSALRRLYGIEPEDYERLLAAQDGVCGICGKSEADSLKRFLCVDHIDGTTKIRGLLCSTCNSAIGLLRHDPELLRRAIIYLAGEPVMEGVLFPRGIHRSRAA